MQLDNTLARIIVEVQKALKAKHNVDMDFDDVVTVIDTQLNCTIFAFSRNIPIQWKGFLKFIWTNRRQRAADKKALFNPILDVNNHLSDKEREHYHYLARVISHSTYKELERLNVNAKALTADEVTALPTKNVKFLNFKSLANKR